MRGKGKRSVPSVSAPLPGPKAARWVKRDSAVISPSYTRQYPLVVERASGAAVFDVDGNRFLDFTAGIAVNATGHSHPEVVEAIVRQAKRFIHMSGTDFYYPQEILLAEKLVSLVPGDAPKKVFFTTSGTESTEAAMKLARYHTRRPLYMAFYGGFHGRSMGALSLTTSKAVHRKGFSPLVPGVVYAPYAYCYRCPLGLKPDDCDIACVKWIKEELFRTTAAPEEIAALFVEPIQGEGGYVVPPLRFLKMLRELCSEYGILMVVDEIQTGIGRTGKMFAFEHSQIVPDIITLAKGLASGLPLGAIISTAQIMDWERGSHGNTFGGNPIACEAALATLRLVEKGLMENARNVGGHLLSRLHEMEKRHRLIGDVRGMGLMAGIELVRDRETKERAVAERDAVIRRCFKKGLLILGAGPNTLRLMPPLTVSRAEVDTALSIIDEALAEVESRAGRPLGKV